MSLSIVVVGYGRLGAALCTELYRLRYTIKGIFGKSKTSTQRLTHDSDIQYHDPSQYSLCRYADIVFITTPDDVIQQVCESIARDQGFTSHSVVFHCSGALTSEILSSARKYGASTGTMHPLQSFSIQKTEQNRFKDIYIAIEGDPVAVETAKKLANDLQSHPFILQTSAKIFYHAAAVVASNYLITLVNMSLQLLEKTGMNKHDGISLLMPLIQGTIENVKKSGTDQALTGPIARGDIDILSKHITAIKEDIPELLDLYVWLGRYTIEIAKLSPKLSSNSVSCLEYLFNNSFGNNKSKIKNQKSENL
ncbi:MAG: DUF2520 domain-containing protein [Desulfobacterales bacterium]|nr:DUF2520 domain-containing protein [Desulfobacterales bacterium]